MAVDIKIDGVLNQNVSAFSVVEDSTPVDISDSSGGYGQFTFSIADTAATPDLIGHTANVSDTSQGTTVGTITGLNGGADGVLNVTADSRMGLLSADRTAQPFVGSLGDAFRYYLGLVGITTGIVVDADLESRAVVLQGWEGNVWDQLKQLMSAEQVETSLVSNNVVLRALRGRVAETYRNSGLTWSLDASQLARSVEIFYYQNEYSPARLAYPIGGWNEDVNVYTVDAGEKIDIDIPVDVSLYSVAQPTCVDWVDRYHVSSSVYAVVGAGEGSTLPVTPAQWAAGGGKVTVAIGEDTRSLKVTITGSSEQRYAPYRIAMTAGPSDSYSSLRIVGAGVFYAPQSVILDTAVDPVKVSQEIGVTVENRNVSTEDEARELGRWAVKRWGSPRYGVNIPSGGINRIGVSGSYAYPTIADFNADPSAASFTAFNAQWTGKTFAEFNAFWKAKSESDFANQAFGNIGGARVPYRDAIFRIRSGNTSRTGVDFAAEEDTTVGDHNVVWAGKTIADWNAEWVGKKYSAFALAPLRKSA